MKSTPILTLLLTLVLGLTVTLLMTESCKKKEDCPTGFSGVNCETEDLCITGNVNCQNGGVCVDGTCDCPDGYFGANCENIDPTKIQVLLDGGATPIALFNSGIPLDSLYGKQYGGGLLYNLDTGTGNVLIATTADQSNSVKWGPTATDITALTDILTIPAAEMDFNGVTNSAAIIAQLGANGGTEYAAKMCADLVDNGFNDWYLPAEGELNKMFEALGPVASGGTGQMVGGFYWSSTERSANAGWYTDFNSGLLNTQQKIANFRCRCIRK